MNTPGVEPTEPGDASREPIAGTVVHAASGASFLQPSIETGMGAGAVAETSGPRCFHDSALLRIILIASLITPRLQYELVTAHLRLSGAAWVPDLSDDVWRWMADAWSVFTGTLALVCARRLGLTLSDLGFRRLRLRALVGWTFAAFVVYLVSKAIIVRAIDGTTLGGLLKVHFAPFQGGVRFDEDPFLVMHRLFSTCIASPLVEEIVFRGLAQSGLTSSRSRWNAALGATVIFAILHAFADPKHFVAPFVTGAAFSIVFAASRNLWPLIACHTLLNLSVWFDRH